MGLDVTSKSNETTEVDTVEIESPSMRIVLASGPFRSS